MPSAKDLLAAKYKPATRTVEVLLDGALAAALDAITEQIRAAEKKASGLVSDVPALTEQLQRLQGEADAATTVFTLVAIPGAELDALKLKHPPSEEQWARYREQAKSMPLFGVGAPEFDALAAAPEWIAKSITHIDDEPVTWTEEDGIELWAVLHDGARSDLYEAAYQLSNKTSARPKSGTGTATTSSTGPHLTTPSAVESPLLSLAEGS